MACNIKYIQNTPLSETEKDRLSDIHVSIFKQAKESKAFREIDNRFQAVKSKYADATSFVGRINQQNIAKIAVLNPIGNGNAVLSVNVLPLSKEQQLPLLQKEGIRPLIASPKVTKLSKDLLERVGVDYERVKDIVVNGEKIGANGAAFITQNLVQVVEGKEALALPEEAMHFAVEILEQSNPRLFNKLLGEINDYKIYKEVLADYSQDINYQIDGKPNIRKLKKEAIAKQLVNTIINRVEGIDDTHSKIAKVQTWWDEILEFIRNLFISSGFDRAAMSIISGENIGTVEDIRATEDVFLQKNSQEDVFNKIKEIQSKIEKKDEGYYVDGKKVPRRVTDLVKDWYERRFKEKQLTASEYDKSVFELKAEKGTDGHKDIENAFSLFVDKDGFLREEPLDDTGYVSQLNLNNREMYELLRTNLKERLNSFPIGTRFMSEAIVYDVKRGLAGTVDFLAITPDAKVSVLDWKFMDLNTDKYKDIPWYKINAWRQQMDQYKLILEKVYGVKSQDFQQTRMIPIKAVYTEGNRKLNILPSLKSIKIGDVNVQNIKDDFLIPVGTEGEKTGNRKIDALIEKLNAVYQKFSDKKALPSEKLSKAEQLNTLFTAIRQLQMKQNLEPLLYQAKVLNKQIQKVIEQYNTNWKGKPSTSFNQSQISNFYEEIETAQNTIVHYTTLDTDLKFLFQGIEDNKLKEELRDVVDNARDLQSELFEVGNSFTDEFIAGSENVDSILAPEKIIKGVTKWFSSTATLQIKSLETLYKKANKAFGLASMDTLDETKKLNRLKEAYETWAQGKGFNNKNYFDSIKKKDKNELIDEFSPEFYKSLKDKIAEKDYNWVRDNVDGTEYNKYLKEKLATEIERIDNKPRIGTEEEVNRQISIEKLKAKNLYDTSTTESVGWLLYNDIRKFPKKDKWETKEWKELNKSENSPALAFYNYIKERNEYYRNIGYIHDKQARTFLPFVRKGLMEKVITGSMPAFGEQFLRAVSIDEGDIGYGKTDPLTGRPIDVIPIYFTKEIEGELSNDLFRNMAFYNEAAIKYKYVSDIEAQARALINIERNKKAIATSMFGKTVYKDGKLEYTPDNNENTKLVEDMVKAIIYGQRYIQSESFDQILGSLGNFGEKANKALGIKMFPENLEGRQVSINKVITQLNNTFQLNALGLNPLSALSNLLGGSFQSIINAETYFTKTDFMASEFWLLINKMTGKDQKKMVGALEYFLPLTEDYNKEIAKTLALNKLSQENIQEFLMILMRKSDFFVQTANFYAYLNNSIVEGDKVVNVREHLRMQSEFQNMYTGTSEQRKARKAKFESEVKRLLEEKGVLKLAKIENNEFVIPGVDRRSDSVIELRRKVQQLSKDALGNLSQDDLRSINMNIFGKSFMLFKNWIPRLVDVRMGNLKYNSGSDAYEWGRMRMVFRVISDDVLRSLTNLTNSLQGNDKGVEYMRQLFEKKKADYEAETGKTLEMTEAEFMDLVRKNIKAQLIDALFMIGLFSLFLGLKALAPDDDEDENVKNAHKFMLRAADKIRDELWFFYDPTSFTSLVSTGIFPSMGYINNFKTLVTNFRKETYGIAIGDDETVEKTYVIKYLMKSFPVTNQATQILPIFYPEMAKDLGLRVSTEARAGAK
jgi:hypothetical protein